jgi:hypothetical protein
VSAASHPKSWLYGCLPIPAAERVKLPTCAGIGAPSASVMTWVTDLFLHPGRTPRTLLTDKLFAREVGGLLGHSRLSQTPDTYVGRKIISRSPADALTALGDGNGSYTEVQLGPSGHRVYDLGLCAARDANPEPADSRTVVFGWLGIEGMTCVFVDCVCSMVVVVWCCSV